MALKLIDHGSPEYLNMVKLRDEVLRRPLGLHFSPEELENEKDDILIGAFEDDTMLGCCLLTRVDDQTVRLRQMAVRNEKQGMGIGRVLMQFAENIARDNRYRTLAMHARMNAVDFYRKLGYQIVGEPFEEVSIPHYLMEKDIAQFRH